MLTYRPRDSLGEAEAPTAPIFYGLSGLTCADACGTPLERSRADALRAESAGATFDEEKRLLALCRHRLYR